MYFAPDSIPALDDRLVPPVVLGTAHLTGFAYQGNGYDSLVERIGPNRTDGGADTEAARLYDTAIACQLAFRRAEGLDLQDQALERSQLFRVGAGADKPLRLLALAGPGDLMVNTPLDFITNAIDVRLDLLYLRADRPLPPVIPDHDVAFFAQSEADEATLVRLKALFRAWPRPVLNDPGLLPNLARDTLAQSLAGVPGIRSPEAVAVTRAALEAHLQSGESIGCDYPCLIRPSGSHAGAGLALTETPAELAAYLRRTFAQTFFLTAFENYISPDGFYRKSRVVFIDRRPFLCHKAISRNWMVHYLNAGMIESADKRAEEAYAMANFDTGFGRRHEAAFEALHDRLGFDYYSIDCAETRDGRLLVFEADTAAIIHQMDPADRFPYKQPQMRKVFAAFETMLRRRADRDCTGFGWRARLERIGAERAPFALR
nr:hypothetical protein [uncultured Rhodopila sp.]